MFSARQREPIASLPGEILPRHEFYSYEAKYLDENGAVLEIPAKLPPETSERIRQLALKTFSVLCCEGMARVDFFLRNGEEIIVNEINTIPGFTRISMYPKLWEATGISYSELIDRLIQLAIERFDREKRLKTDRS
jgi:D-alanine-D-alanine ligase